MINEVIYVAIACYDSLQRVVNVEHSGRVNSLLACLVVRIGKAKRIFYVFPAVVLFRFPI